MELFSEIYLDSDDSEDLSDSEIFYKKPITPRYSQSNQRLQPPKKPIHFEDYIRDKCQNKVKILNRSIFSQISKPIIIFFNHFREKCAYHTKCLDTFYHLALKYEDKIEIIAADMLDIDIMNSKWNSIQTFCNLVSPQRESASVYAIDEQKRIHQYFSATKTLEELTDLCENLLNDRLFITEPIPEPNTSSLVKICVHQNYQELVTNSPKHILLIVNLEDYCNINLEYEPNYEIVAEQLKSYNVDVVHINSEKNYIPFELGIFCYPTLLLLPQNDKINYVDFLKGPRNTENIVDCIKSYLSDPESYLQQRDKEFVKYRYKPLKITSDFNMDFKDLPQYLLNNCHYNMKVFDRQTLLKANYYFIIIFMDFSGGKCLVHHLKWIDQIYQVASNLSSLKEYLIADYKDIDVISPQWKPQDFIKNNQAENMTPTVIGMDYKKNKFIMKDYKTTASLFYFVYDLSIGELYFSEPWPPIDNGKLVKTCIADNLNLCISSIKKNIFLVIYHSNMECCEQFLQLLEEVAMDTKNISLKIMKIDARLNYIPLEMDDSIYPILYFIPQTNKCQPIRYYADNLVKEDVVNFITKNVLKTA